MRHRPRATPPQWWDDFTTWLGLGARDASRLWRALAASTHPAVRAWRLAVAYGGAHGYTCQQDRILKHGPMRPTTFLPVLEVLVDEKRLSRGAVTAIEERCLAHTNREGAWK